MSIDSEVHTVVGMVEVFDLPSTWFYVRVPQNQTKKFSGRLGWGLIPIEVSLGKTTWQTSLLPKGDKNFFIALKAEVRRKERVKLGDKISLTYKLRGR
jgi:hypothetical protein